MEVLKGVITCIESNPNIRKLNLHIREYHDSFTRSEHRYYIRKLLEAVCDLEELEELELELNVPK